jgi:hypothetical protein
MAAYHALDQAEPTQNEDEDEDDYAGGQATLREMLQTLLPTYTNGVYQDWMASAEARELARVPFNPDFHNTPNTSAQAMNRGGVQALAFETRQAFLAKWRPYFFENDGEPLFTFGKTPHKLLKAMVRTSHNFSCTVRLFRALL